jgi:hypothetical protein
MVEIIQHLRRVIGFEHPYEVMGTPAIFLSRNGLLPHDSLVTCFRPSAAQAQCLAQEML